MQICTADPAASSILYFSIWANSELFRAYQISSPFWMFSVTWIFLSWILCIPKLWYRSGQVLIHSEDLKYHGNPEKAQCWVKSTSERLCSRILGLGKFSGQRDLHQSDFLTSFGTCSPSTENSWTRQILRSASTQQRTMWVAWEVLLPVFWHLAAELFDDWHWSSSGPLSTL